MGGIEPPIPDYKTGVLPLALIQHKLGGDGGNQTHHTILARDRRPLGTCAPKIKLGANPFRLVFWRFPPVPRLTVTPTNHLAKSLWWQWALIT